MQYARERGISEIVGRLRELKQLYGERFEPDEAWQQLAELKD
jgi:hypothetical protein